MSHLRDAIGSLWALLTADEPVSPDASAPSRAHRARVAVMIGVLSGLFCWLCSLRPGSRADFFYPHAAAGYFLDGLNPYAVMGTTGAALANETTLYYPFTAVLAALPVARLPLSIASALFIACSSALLAYHITRDGLWRVHIFASSSFVITALLAQFSPLVMLMAFSAWGGMAAALKPNIGLAMFARRPSMAAAMAGLALVAVSLLVFPPWPTHWLHALRADVNDTQVHVMPVRAAGGVLLLLSALAWRRPGGRLLLAMSFIPQLLFFYDTLLLWLIPRTRQQSIFLTACSQAAAISWYVFIREGQSVVRSAAPSVLWLIYMPALALVLWQWWHDRKARGQ